MPPLNESGAVAEARPFQVITRILVAEDSATARVLLRHLLTTLFPLAEIEEAVDGRSALKALSTARMDLIITDLQMPGLDGQSFIQMLRRTSVLKRKPVLVVTMSPDLAGAELLSDPCLRVLGKPLREEALRQALGELLA